MARKISFGSHPDAGAKTPETLMTVLKTLKLRTKSDVKTAFANLLNQLAENPGIDRYECLAFNEYLTTCKKNFTSEEKNT
jgi:hypothetical protein